MIDTSKPIENPTLLRALDQLHKCNTPENQNTVLDEVMMRAHFLAPVEIAPGKDTNSEDVVQFQLISSQDGRNFFPAFTDWNELRKLCGPKDQKTVVLTFDDYAAMLAGDGRAAGFVVNPLGTPLTLDRDFVAFLAKQKQEKAGYSHQTISKNTKVLLSDPEDYPQELVDALRLAVAPLSVVDKLYLRLMTRPGQSLSSYLIIVEHSGQQDTVFRAIAEAARPHIKDKYVDMVPFDSEFGQAAAQGASPFFARKK
jgi:hypothetical protein